MDVKDSNTKNYPSHSRLQFKIACYLAKENLDIFNINNLSYICDKHNITVIKNFLPYALSSTFMKWHTLPQVTIYPSYH
jgi:hypothetical protein